MPELPGVTEGEWEVFDVSVFEPGYRILSMQERDTYCTVAREIDPQEDAFVMAAAKEMYDALLPLIDYAMQIYDRTGTTSRAITQAEAALAKARGEGVTIKKGRP